MATVTEIEEYLIVQRQADEVLKSAGLYETDLPEGFLAMLLATCDTMDDILSAVERYAVENLTPDGVTFEELGWT